MAGDKNNNNRNHKDEQDEDLLSAIPLAIKRLYPDGDKDPRELSMVTETPPHMIMPLVRMRMVSESLKEGRERSLLEIFVDEFDRRMISRARRGREEFIDIMAQDKEQDVDDLEI